MKAGRIIRRFLAATAAIVIFIAAFHTFWLSPRYVVPILMYHRFGHEESTLFVTPQNFKRQMAYLKRKNYNVISLNELAEGIKADRKFRHNTVVITIDDGYEDNYKYAYPVLKKYKFPATIFIASNLIGNAKDFLTWEQIKDMLKDGTTFGGHTKHHVYLPSIIDDKVLWDEIAGAKEVIEKNTNAATNYFCYPTGGFNQKVKETVKKAGYKAACTTNRGLVDFNKDLYELKRVKVTNSDTNKPLSFRAKLSGYYNLFRSKKRGN